MRRQVGWLVCLALLVGACAADPTTAPGGQDTVAGTEFPTSTTGAGDDTLSNTDRPTSTTGAAGVVGLFASALVEFDSCAAFIDHVKAEALERVGPYGLDGDLRVGIMEEMMMEAAAADSAEAAAPAATSAPQAGVDYSTTNIQEIGVDEPDIVKTDGNRILVLADGTLHYVDVSSGRPELVGTLDMWSSWSWQDRDDHYWNHEMFLGIDTALLIAGGYGDRGDLTQVVHVDLSDPENLTAGDTLTVEGRYVSARLVGDRVSVVLSSRPHERIEFVYPQSEAGENRAEQANRQAIIESTIEDWAPGYVLDSTGGNAEGLFIDCGSAYAPEEFSGFDFLSVFSFDMAGGIDHRGVSTVMSGGDTVYASTTNLYVATERWVDWMALEEGRRRQGSGDHHHSHPPVRHQRSRRGRIPGKRFGGRVPPQPVRHVRAPGIPAGRVHGRSRLGLVGPAGSTVGQSGGRAREGRAGTPDRRVCRRPRAGRADLRRPVHGRGGLHRHLPPDRSSLHSRSFGPPQPSGDGGAQDPGLLRLPAPDRRRSPAGDRPGRRRARQDAGHPALGVRCLRSVQPHPDTPAHLAGMVGLGSGVGSPGLPVLGPRRDRRDAGQLVEVRRGVGHLGAVQRSDRLLGGWRRDPATGHG